MNERIATFNRILKIREDLRKDEQAVLASERNEEREVLNQLTRLENERAQAINDFSRTGTQAVSANDLWFQRQFIDAINTDIMHGNQALDDVRARIVDTEARLVEKHKDVRIMETYIDHLKEADFHEQLNLEQNELDDVATMQYSRKEAI
ncbi:MAG: flagellar export protein FliJ [Synergistaceae bacterium]|nr:flagellar export protein FliJ [Synergistaceae bacterium]